MRAGQIVEVATICRFTDLLVVAATPTGTVFAVARGGTAVVVTTNQAQM